MERVSLKGWALFVDLRDIGDVLWRQENVLVMWEGPAEGDCRYVAPPSESDGQFGGSCR